MFIKVLRTRFDTYKSKKCIVFQDNICTYQDIIESWAHWKKEFKSKNIPNDSIIMVKGDFSVSTIGLMLTIIENNSVYVPVSPAVKNVDDYQQIAEVTHYFNCIDNEYKTFDRVPKNPLLKGLLALNEPGLVLFSSGTTGRPKASLHNVTNLLNKYENEGKPFTSIAFLLFDHIGGFNTVLYNLSSGGIIVVPSKRSPEKILQLIDRHQVNLLPTSPSFINMLLMSKSYEKYNLNSLKIVTYGTEPMPETTLKHFNKIFPNIQLKQTYGLSEVGILRSKSKSSDSLWMKLGDDDHLVDVREGILWIKSKMSMLGYLNAESPFDENGWFNTKDQVLVDGDYFKVLGRTSDIINVGGEKVYPSEIESVILNVPGVNEAIVKGLPNTIMGNVVTCYVLKDENHSAQEVKQRIKKTCSNQLEKFKRPVKIFFSDDSFYTERFKKGLGAR